MSGHATKTTAGGTLRSLILAWCYLVNCGIKEPWSPDCKDVFVIASGDDVVIFCKPELAERIKKSILKLSSRTTEPLRKCDRTGEDIPNVVGFGQCIKKVIIGDRFDVNEFCSKFSHSPDGSLESWKMIRNPAKALYDKQIVSESNIEFFENPYLHKLGCLVQLRAEKISKTIEDILMIQVIHHLPIDDIRASVEKLARSDAVRYKYS